MFALILLFRFTKPRNYKDEPECRLFHTFHLVAIILLPQHRDKKVGLHLLSDLFSQPFSDADCVDKPQVSQKIIDDQNNHHLRRTLNFFSIVQGLLLKHAVVRLGWIVSPDLRCHFECPYHALSVCGISKPPSHLLVQRTGKRAFGCMCYIPIKLKLSSTFDVQISVSPQDRAFSW